jgi:hypothetical protein
MVPTDAEIAETQQKSEELAIGAERLAAEAADEKKQINTLLADCDVEFGRMAEVLQTRDPPEGTGVACLMATIELFGDWGDLEVTAIEALDGPLGGGPRKSVNGAARAMRRGMRI